MVIHREVDKFNSRQRKVAEMWMKTRNNNKCHEHADTTYQSKLEDSSPTKEDKDSDQETNITSSRHKEDNEDNIQGSESEE